MTNLVAVGAAARPHPNESVSGDAWSVQVVGHVWRLALVDGAGHGVQAAEAARIAIDTFEGEPSLDAGEILRQCHARLRGTRGAVMAIASVDLDRHFLEVAGVGNIDARLLTTDLEKHPVSQRGMLGANIPATIRPTTFELPDKWMLVLHSDGIRNRYRLSEIADYGEDKSPQAVADRILADYSRQDDDATVVVASLKSDGLRPH